MPALMQLCPLATASADIIQFNGEQVAELKGPDSAHKSASQQAFSSF